MTKSKSGPEFLKIPFKFNMSEFSSAWLKFQLVGFIQHSSQLKSLWKWILSSMVLAVFPGFNPPAAAKSLQSFLTLCDPIDGSLSGSTVPGILQARTLEWVTISFSSASKWKVKVKSLSRVWPPGLQPTRLLRPWEVPGKSTGVGCHCLLPLSNICSCFYVFYLRSWSFNHYEIFLCTSQVYFVWC